MCTLTFIPKGKSDFILTSNRDEAPNRPTLAPDFYIENGVKLLYPKDEKAGGTWIGVSEKSRLVCLLNGGFVAHKHGLTYRISRGVVVKDVLKATDFLHTLKTYNLMGVEPFTLIIVDWQNALQVCQLVWDGDEKHIEILPNEPRIWSSSSLYTKAMKEKRLQWFETFKKENDFKGESLMRFHKTGGKGNSEFSLIMDREFVKTTSITQIEKAEAAVKMRYTNFKDDEVVEKVMLFSEEK
ncbi:hypothetical protein BZARG_981 [Bizionia argentinensis JUB59]|uniref:NRDE family protein n=1 Tax=Bizionia argentinensis JUB59 TaxID=1046627 RepID=G2EBV2_9FLAO|nr:NRDE family protein [Bizionia argentinensis]EGV44074.1 hypothetical protein BZARG_981 [Bizionia argentinensis JUB59]